MKMKQFLALVRLQARMVLRNRQSVGWIVLFPVGMMLFWGYIGRGGTVRATFGGAATVAYTGFMMGGMVVLAALSEGVMGYSQVMTNLRAQGILRRVRCTPLPAWGFLASRMVVEVGLVLASALLVIGVAVVVFGVRLSLATLPVAFGLLLLSIALFVGIGQLISSVVRRPETVRGVAQAVAFPLMFVGGIYLQPDLFPPRLAAVAQWTPAAIAADLLRPALLQGNLGARPVASLLALVAYIAVALALAARYFRWEEAA